MYEYEIIEKFIFFRTCVASRPHVSKDDICIRVYDST